jgi:hypothetical protein
MLNNSRDSTQVRSDTYADAIQVNDKIYEKSLLLRGIYKKSHKKIEELFKENLLEEAVQKQMKFYDKIPSHFYSLEQWIKQTNILCWFCSNIIRGVPVFVPKHIEARCFDHTNEKGYTINVEGVFCKFSCGQAYIDLVYSSDLSIYLNRCDMLKLLYHIFNGRRTAYIKPSPPKYKMIQYGGNVSPADYEKEIEILNAQQFREVSNTFAHLENICEE